MTFKSIAKFFLGKKYGQKLFRFLFLFSLKGMNFGGGSDLKESGEKWVLEYFAGQSSASKNLTVFDVGANKGDYALEANSILKSAGFKYQVFCFEPAQDTFEKLKNNTSGFPSIKCFNIALGESAARLPLYSTKASSGLASLYNRESVAMESREEVAVEALDVFCQQQNISRVDFLKLDVEGNEYKVLLGAKKLLEAGNIKFIQFEFGGTDIDSKVFFRDFFKLLSPNYDISRILKNGLYPIRVYKETDEIFITTNYLASLKIHA